MVGRHQTAQEVNFLKEVFHKNWKQLKGGNTVDMMAANAASSSLTPRAFKEYYSSELESLNMQLDNQKQILNSVFLDAERNKLKQRRGFVVQPDTLGDRRESESTNTNRKRQSARRLSRSINRARARARKLQEEEEKLAEQLKNVEIRRRDMRQVRGSAWAPCAESGIQTDDRIVLGFEQRRPQTSIPLSYHHKSGKGLSSRKQHHKIQEKSRGREGRGVGNIVLLRSQQREIEKHANTVFERGFRLAPAERPRTSDATSFDHFGKRNATVRGPGFTGRSVPRGDGKEEEEKRANGSIREQRSSRQTQGQKEEKKKSQQRPSTAGSCCTQCCGKESHRRTRLETRFHHFLEQQFITMNQATLKPEANLELIEKVNPGLKEFNRKIGLKPMVMNGPHPC